MFQSIITNLLVFLLEQLYRRQLYMEQSSHRRHLAFKEINHKKIHSFELQDIHQANRHQNNKIATLKNSKSSADIRNYKTILQINTSQAYFSNIYHKNPIKKIVVKPKDKQNKQTFFSKVYNNKISKLITSNTQQQKERYLRKLNQAVSQDTFKAIGYEFDQSYIKYIQAFLLTTTITKIVLDNNPLGDAGVIKLITVFPKIQLKQLSLVSVNMGNYGASNLFISLKEVSTLLKLNVSTSQTMNKNRITSQGVQPLKLLLNSTTCILETLQMNHLRLGSQGAKIAFQGVTSTTLQYLSLSKNDIGAKNINCLGQSLSRIPLIMLDLSKNSIQDTGIKCLADILGFFYNKNTISMSLTHLNLSSNSITSVGFQYFCKDMISNRTLQTLILDQNPLGEGDRFFNVKYYLSKNWGLKKISFCNISSGDKDIKFICQGLQGNRSLEQLVLSKNQINEQILSFIFVMLTKNRSLRRLIVNNCKISDNYLVRNQHMLGCHFSAIEEIDLQNNYINTKGAHILKKIIANNRNILKLSLLKNCIPETYIDQISEILKENQSKRPFEHQLNYFQSVYELYEQKKKALRGEVEKIKKYEQKLQTHLLAQQIQFNLTIEQHLKKKIAKQHSKIRQYKSNFSVKMDDIQSDFDQQPRFVTNAEVYKR